MGRQVTFTVWRHTETRHVWSSGRQMVGEDIIDDMLVEKSGVRASVSDHLSNRRTMLAWARTGIAVMALGFVVSRFGLLLRELKPRLPRPFPQSVSTMFGATLVAIGGLLIILATFDYLRTGRAIDRNSYHWSPALEVALSLMLVTAGVVLTVYLVLTG